MNAARDTPLFYVVKTCIIKDCIGQDCAVRACIVKACIGATCACGAKFYGELRITKRSSSAPS
ncbi:hypothetical protein [uncultured Campylobacter sp.]|uniref:hypothetical protein n=1 Tax=uncultured Campylobacter sp. TaxID=218934 RepID=UPI0026320F43|nr:hypothetical protein [uncultured Campylobacter sp.]